METYKATEPGRANGIVCRIVDLMIQPTKNDCFPSKIGVWFRLLRPIILSIRVDEYPNGAFARLQARLHGVLRARLWRIEKNCD